MIKIEHTKTHKLVSNRGTDVGISYNVYNNILVCDAELILVVCKPEDALLFRYKSTDTVHILPKKGMLVKGLVDYLVPILISRKEKIEEGDWVLLYTKEIVKAKKGVIGVVYETPSGIDMDFQEGLDFKILALPEHFSKLQIHMIVDDKVKNGDKVLVECEDLCDYEGEELWEITPNKIIKQNPQITIYPVEEKMYTREEVKQLFISLLETKKDIIVKHQLGLKINDGVFNKWFEQNVK